MSDEKKPEAEAEEEAAPSAPSAPPARTWNGMPVYACEICAFDSLDEAALEEHVKKAHLPEEAPAARTVVLTDRFGNVQEG